MKNHSFVYKNLFLFLLYLSCTASYGQQTTNIDLDKYGGQTSFGFSLGDGLGPVVRQYLSPRTVLEAGMYYGSSLAPQENNNGDNPGGDFNTEFGFVIDFAVHAYGKRFFKEKKNRIKANGFTLRTGHMFGKFSTSHMAAGWTQEIFRERNPKRSFIFELGLKGYLPHWDAKENSMGSPFDYKEAKASVFPYLRLHWNWFVK